MDELVERLAVIPGVVAVVLGGSRAVASTVPTATRISESTTEVAWTSISCESWPGNAGLAVVQMDRERRSARELAQQIEGVRCGGLDRLPGLDDRVLRMLDRPMTADPDDGSPDMLQQIERMTAEHLHQTGAGCPVVGVRRPAGDLLGGSLGPRAVQPIIVAAGGPRTGL
jgi:hypothetical protein